MDGVPAGAGGGRGWVVPELLVALVVFGLLVGLVVQTAITVDAAMGALDREMRMYQTAAAAVHCVLRDARSAGCDPHGTAAVGVEIGTPAPGGEGGATVRFALDTRGGKPGTRPDGDAGDPDERLAYRWSPADGVLRRNGQPVALGISSDPEGVPLFRLRGKGGESLLEVTVCLQFGGTVVRARSAVHVRNAAGSGMHTGVPGGRNGPGGYER